MRLRVIIILVDWMVMFVFSIWTALLQLGRRQQTSPTIDHEKEEDNDCYMSLENTDEDDSDIEAEDGQGHRDSLPSLLLPPLPDHVFLDYIWEPCMSTTLSNNRLRQFRTISHAWMKLIDDHFQRLDEYYYTYSELMENIHAGGYYDD